MLSDGKIYLRRLEESDLERTLVWINKPEIYLRIGVNAPISRTQQESWFRGLQKQTDKVVFAVCEVQGDRHIGNVSLDTIDSRHRTARLSIFIAEATQRGGGLGNRAIRLLLEYAFDSLDLNKVWCKVTHDEENIPSFYEKLGFRVEGKLRQHEFIDGAYVDKVLLGILKEERPDPADLV